MNLYLEFNHYKLNGNSISQKYETNIAIILYVYWRREQNINLHVNEGLKSLYVRLHAKLKSWGGLREKNHLQKSCPKNVMNEHEKKKIVELLNTLFTEIFSQNISLRHL